MDKTQRAFIGLNIAIILASLLLGTTLAVRYKSLTSEAANGSCSDHESASACQGSCSRNNFKCTWRSATGRCNESAIECGSSGGGSGTGNNTTQTSCQNGGGFWCDGVRDSNNNLIPGFCTSQNQTCISRAADNGHQVFLGCSNPVWNSDIGDGNASTWTAGEFICPDADNPTGDYQNYVIYICSQAEYQRDGGVCDANTPGVDVRRSGGLPNCFCGIAQIDEVGGSNRHQSYRNSCGCNNESDNVQPTSTPTPTPSPTPSPTPTSTPTPTPSPTPSPTPTATPTKTPTSTPTATPTSTPTGEPNYCGGTCGSNSNCQGGYFCYQGFCRNPQCAQESDCSCKTTSTPPPVLGQTAPPVLPKTGGSVAAQIGLFGIVALGVYLFKKFRLI